VKALVGAAVAATLAITAMRDMTGEVTR